MYGCSRAVVLGLLLDIAGVICWRHSTASSARQHRGRSQTRHSRIRTLSRMSCDDVIDVSSMWPELTGKQTSANSDAGKLIREAWAAELAQQTTDNDRNQGRTWSIIRQVVDYKHGEVHLQGLYARPEGEGLPEKLPGVILAHTAVGPQEDFILWKLDSLATAGYAASALDMFGAGHALWNRSESLAARRVITEDRSLMQARAGAGLRTLRGLVGVDSDRIAAVGYCFGGMSVLDLARMGAPRGLRAVASLHGILVPISAGAGKDPSLDDIPINPRILILHASGDPFVPPEQVQAMKKEFERRGARLEIVNYGGKARHAFTRPEKVTPADQEAGLSYDEKADIDSWRRVTDMLQRELR